jgi:SAM-dependent methyltransferase
MDIPEYERMYALEHRMWWYRGLHALLGWALVAARPKAGLLLDAGCGTGGLLASITGGLAGRRLIGLDFIGLDLEPVALGLARRKSASAWVAGSVNNLPFADNRFAVVLSADVLCHDNVDPAAALAEAARCLMPGGIMILNLPAYGWLLSAHDRHVHNTRRFTRTEVAALMHRAGLRPRRLTYWNTVLFPVLVVWRKLIGRRHGSSDVGDFPRFLDRLFGLALAMERLYLRSGGRFPFGGSILAIVEKP